MHFFDFPRPEITEKKPKIIFQFKSTTFLPQAFLKIPKISTASAKFFLYNFIFKKLNFNWKSDQNANELFINFMMMSKNKEMKIIRYDPKSSWESVKSLNKVWSWENWKQPKKNDQTHPTFDRKARRGTMRVGVKISPVTSRTLGQTPGYVP